MTLLLLLLLVGCDAPCDPDANVCDGLFRTGQLGLESNRSAVSGDYAPKLAGCTQTLIADGEVVEWSTWDDRGRRVEQFVDDFVGAGSTLVRQLEWDGPCMTASFEDIAIDGEQGAECAFSGAWTCDDHGWPVELVRTFNETPNPPILYDNDYVDGRLVASRTLDSETLEVQSSVEHEWVEGRAVRTRHLDREGVEQWRMDRRFGDDQLLSTISTASGEAVQRFWSYDGEDRLVSSDERDWVRTWSYRDGADLPHRLTESGQVWKIETQCP